MNDLVQMVVPLPSYIGKPSKWTQKGGSTTAEGRGGGGRGEGRGGVGGREGTRYSKEATQHDSDITEVQ